MADFNSALPIRTENPGDAAVKVVDSTTPAQGLKVNSDGTVEARLKDGTGNAITSQTSGAQKALDVGVNVAGVQVDPRAVRALTAVDVVSAKIQDAAGAGITSSLQGAKQSLHTAVVNAAGTIVDPTQIRSLTAASDSVAIKNGANQLAVNADGSTNVNIVSSIAGTAINDYNTSTAIAAGATSNHDYTVTAGKTLYLSQITSAASGMMKIEIQAETGVATNVFTTKFVQFTSASHLNADLELVDPVLVAAGVRVRVIRTNRDKSAQDVYTTISGNEI